MLIDLIDLIKSNFLSGQTLFIRTGTLMHWWIFKIAPADNQLTRVNWRKKGDWGWRGLVQGLFHILFVRSLWSNWIPTYLPSPLFASHRSPCPKSGLTISTPRPLSSLHPQPKTLKFAFRKKLLILITQGSSKNTIHWGKKRPFNTTNNTTKTLEF